MSNQPPEKPGESRSYWTHAVGAFPGPVAVGRMSQLIDFDPRLTEAARVVYRFLINWYHHEHGDALLSQRHVARVMRQRAPAGAECPSRSAVSRAIILLLDNGWVARTARGRGRNKSASRYIPVFNVLDLAEQGRFPEPAHLAGQLAHDDNWPTERATTGPHGGPVDGRTGPASGPKTLLLDSGTDPRTVSTEKVSPPPAGLAAAAAGGFEKVWIAYGRLGSKVAARKAFAAITNPDIDHIAARASAWAASAKPGQRRMPLEKWIAAERWDEADRKPAKSATTKSGTTQRDITVHTLRAGDNGYVLTFNYGDRGDPSTHTTLPIGHDAVTSLAVATGGRARDAAGARVTLVMAADDSISFLPRAANGNLPWGDAA